MGQLMIRNLVYGMQDNVENPRHKFDKVLIIAFIYVIRPGSDVL